MKLFNALKKSLKKENYSDESVYKFNISILIASIILFCFGCILFFCI